MANGVPTDPKDKLIDEVKAGLVVILIYYSPATNKVKPAATQNGAGQTPASPESTVKTYDSYLTPHGEGSEPPARKELSGPNQRWCWDNSFLVAFQKGVHLCLYLLLDDCKALRDRGVWNFILAVANLACAMGNSI